VRIVRATAVACASIGMTTLLPGMAGATPQPGSCTSSYQIYNQPDLQAIDSAVTPDLFKLIDTNNDLYICFKPYPNGDHHGHGGNLVDDKSGPKS
jgi:hypothetical protein